MLDKDIINLYNRGLSIYRVADEIGLTRGQVHYILQKNNVKMRKHSLGGKHNRQHIKHKCPYCTSVVKEEGPCKWCIDTYSKDTDKGYYLYKKDFVV